MVSIFDRAYLRHWAADGDFALGVVYYREGCVVASSALRVESRTFVLALVQEAAEVPYQTTLAWDDPEQLEAWCTCNAEGRHCRHAVAAALAYLEGPGRGREPIVLPPAGGLVTSTEEAEAEAEVAGPGEGRGRDGHPALRFKVRVHDTAIKRPYAAKGIGCLWLAVERTSGRRGATAIALGDDVPPWMQNLQGPDREVMGTLRALARLYAGGRSAVGTLGLPVPGILLNRVLGLLLQSKSRLVDAENRPLRIDPTPLPPDVPVAARGQLIGENEGWILLPGTLRPTGPLDESPWPRDGWVPPDDLPAFRAAYLPHLPAGGLLGDEGDQGIAIREDMAPRPGLRLQEDRGDLLVTVTFRYGASQPVGVADRLEVVAAGPSQPRVWWRRQLLAELASARRMLACGVDPFREAVIRLGSDPARDFLLDHLPLLRREGWDVRGDANLADLQVVAQGVSASVSVVKSGTDWLDMKTTFKVGDEEIPWEVIQLAIKRGNGYIKLKSGEHARLPLAWLAKRTEVLEGLGLDPASGGGAEGLRVPVYHAAALDGIAEGADEVDADPSYKALVERFKDFKRIEALSLPATFKGTLRPYQQEGANFLGFLRDHGLNGILADDMGLGKTVQTIALLANDVAAGREGPCLLVAPTSVVYNWQRELSRFAPSLKVLVAHGDDRERRKEILAKKDLILTSYGILRKDADLWSSLKWRYVILDEAQVIKNPHSQTAQAARLLSAEHKLVLTGTPIENRLTDLWSLFAFLMPGLLGSEKAFHERYVVPVQRGESKRLAELKRVASPFILRRLKQDVAKDLPPRTEVVHYCEMEPEQLSLYKAAMTAARTQVTNLAANPSGQAHMAILEALLRLRQICCDPALLIKEGEPPPSGKVETFMELIDEMVAEGHRVLVFSQFVQLLTILRGRLDRIGMRYSYLDGSTRDRQAQVDTFNANPEIPLFLISLKAGGTGLNLTGADYVIHFDPWWNPAVEDQATDRAHRIGQERQVFSYKLIARGTIEEKILELQQQKRALVQGVLDTEEFGKRLTREDLEFLFT